MRPIVRLLLALLLAIAALPCAARTPLTVFAASSLKETLDDAGALYNRDWMDVLQARGLVDARTRRDIAGNALVLVVPAASRTPALVLRRGVDLRPAMGREGRIAMALTASVPAGRYGRAALESLGLWPALRPSIVEAENVRAALQLVARGEVSLGIVYASDAQAEPRVRVVGRFAAASHPRIVYPAARVADSSHPDAAAFVAWLRSPAAQAVFRRHGFLPPR